MLLFLVIPLLGVLAIVADVLRFRRLRQQHRRIAPLRMLWCGATDLIPVAVPLAGLVVSDNTTGYMAAVMCSCGSGCSPCCRGSFTIFFGCCTSAARAS